MLSAQDLLCRRNGHRLFSPVSFAMPKGGIIWLRGKNGSGKTTLLRALAGLFPFDEGCINWRGKVVPSSEIAAARMAFFSSHQAALKSSLSIEENLIFWNYMLMEKKTPAVDHAIHFFQLQPLRKTPVGSLSAGERKRAALSILMLQEAPLWLLDEPYVNLDSDMRRLLDILVTNHCNKGGLAVIAAHEALNFPNQQSVILDRQNHHGTI